ncbi:MAG: AmmeMemoRadiSam system protein B, partial [Candidatus Woesearchaeota archaeon]
MRKPIVAGQFYEGSKERLLSQISECYSHPFGAGKQERRAVKLMILPHAGYPFSGPCATQGYARLARPNKIILLGPSHAGFATCVSEDSWETPLGVVETEKISEKTGIPVDEYGHGTEHSLEVQIPFLQAMFEEVPPIVPVMVSSDPVDTGRRLSQVYETGDTIIVSSDFTHYG